MNKQSINIMGVVYTIDSVDDYRDVDIEGKDTSILAQVEHMGRSIRIFDDGKPKDKQEEFPFFLLIHEMLHGIAWCTNTRCLMGEDNEDALDTMATALADTLLRNDMIKEEWVK